VGQAGPSGLLPFSSLAARDDYADNQIDALLYIAREASAALLTGPGRTQQFADDLAASLLTLVLRVALLLFRFP